MAGPRTRKNSSSGTRGKRGNGGKGDIVRDVIPPPRWILEDPELSEEDKASYGLELPCRVEEIELSEAAEIARKSYGARYEVGVLEHKLADTTVAGAQLRHYQVPLGELGAFLLAMYERYGGIPDLVYVRRIEGEPHDE
ncbi:MAG: hypothetical protein ACE5O2_02165 [Armatimonadota bacterium]